MLLCPHEMLQNHPIGIEGVKVQNKSCQGQGWTTPRSGFVQPGSQAGRRANARRPLLSTLGVWLITKSHKGERMIFCRCCGKEIHETASACPHCGGIQHSPAVAPHHQNPDGPLWVPITSLVLGIVCALSLFDDSQWDKDTILGVGSFSVASLVLGAISLNKQKTGKGMAITGVVLSSIALLALIGMLST